jgi:RHH-type transcriptional regulator, rel operon repressor / antitoxin RelB
MSTTALKKHKTGKPANYSMILPPEILVRLDRLAQATHRSKAFYIKEALAEYLEDQEDAYLALERLNNKNAEYLSHEDARKYLEL